MQTKSSVGNDLVDISLKEILEKYKDERFVKRVLSASEQAMLLKSKEPEYLLWYFWSAKEAAYKALRKVDSKIFFSPLTLVVEINDELCFGNIIYEDKLINLFWVRSENWIHCSATISERESNLQTDFKVMNLNDFWDRSHHFTKRERVSIHSDGSAAVRVLAKTLLYQKGIESVEIIREPSGKKYLPPEIHYKSIKLSNWDISMSHDGEFVACLVAKSL